MRIWFKVFFLAVAFPALFLSSPILAQSDAVNGLIEPCPGSTQENPIYPGDPNCREANIILLQLIRLGGFAFQILGAVAFLFLVYGGFLVIWSQGATDKAKKGFDILVGSVIGLFIAMSAYLIVNFFLDTIGVQEDFRVVTPQTAPVDGEPQTNP